MLSDIIEKYSKNKGTTVYLSVFVSPVGKIVSAANDKYLYFVLFIDSKDLSQKLQTIAKRNNCTYVQDKNEILTKFEMELNQYFKGDLRVFTTPIKMCGSHFQKEVWNKLLTVPYGTTSTYGDLAIALGKNVRHARAIGGACGANSYILLIPCHRIVASNSKGGFSCGIKRKEWLLEHENTFSLGVDPKNYV